MLTNQQYLVVGCIFGLLLFSSLYKQRLNTYQVLRLLTLMTTVFLFYMDIYATNSKQ
jgi:hypothetical protein